MRMNHAANLALLQLLAGATQLTNANLSEGTRSTMDATTSRLRKLRDRGLVAQVDKGAWSITDAGRKETSTAPDPSEEAVDRPANPADDVPKVISAENLRKFCAYPRMSSEVARFFGITKQTAEYELSRHKTAAKLKGEKDTLGNRIVVLWKSDLPNPCFDQEKPSTRRRNGGPAQKKSRSAATAEG